MVLLVGQGVQGVSFLVFVLTSRISMISKLVFGQSICSRDCDGFVINVSV
uniref:Uncharacterized protein n=1 Tax=Octopus bimaculoides TaxID=37653 RepID=A0A0L8G2N1_OCTBM